jgi:hypothetical protein
MSRRDASMIAALSLIWGASFMLIGGRQSTDA